MFARVFNTAKRILSQSPSVQGRAEESNEDEDALRSIEADADADADMVTTRRGTGTDLSAASTPRSSTRKTRGKRDLESLGAEETPTATKRRRKSVGAQQSPPKEADEEAAGSILDTITVAIPDRTKEKSPSPVQQEEPRSTRRGHTRVVITKKPSPQAIAEPSPAEPAGENEPSTTQETIFHTPGTDVPGSVYATPTEAVEGKNGSPKLKPIKKGTPKSASSSQKKKSGKQAVKSGIVASASIFPDEIPSSTWETDNGPINTQDSAPTPTPATKSQQIRFNSEEPITAFATSQSKPAEVAQADAEDDDASDSDAEPEMVTAATAVSKAKATEEDAARAHEAQQAKEERKKGQRAQRIAEEQTEKRKREEAKARKLAKRQAREERLGQDTSPARAPLDVDVSDLPVLLPDSILEAAGDRRPLTPPPMRPGKTVEEVHKEKLNRHINFLEQSEKPVKDVKRGSVHVSVLAKQNALLAPKASKNTKNVREHWLKGREQDKKPKKGSGRVQFRKMERRAVGGGFLRGGDD